MGRSRRTKRRSGGTAIVRKHCLLGAPTPPDRFRRLPGTSTNRAGSTEVAAQTGGLDWPLGGELFAEGIPAANPRKLVFP
jgi:hypothetical protein